MTRHYFLFQFSVGSDLTLSTTDADDARKVLEFAHTVATAHLTPWMDITETVGVKLVHGVRTRVNLAHVVSISYSTAEVAE